MISDFDIALRLAVAAVLGCAIGFERERLLWAAGIRTHMLVAVGSCLLMIVSAYGFEHALLMPHVVLDPSRIAAQVVSGIGFLGAGSILLRGQVVRGLTTAASVWTVAAIGLAAGGGLYFAAIVSTAIILGILAGLKPLEEAYRARVQSAVIKVAAQPGALTPDHLHKLIGVRPGQVRRITARETGGEVEHLTLVLSRISSSDLDRITLKLRRRPDVTEVEVVKGKSPAPKHVEER
ncbi:MAG: MgtC/SapB family protein [Caulobacteraceae bacterium]